MWSKNKKEKWSRSRKLNSFNLATFSLHNFHNFCSSIYIILRIIFIYTKSFTKRYSSFNQCCGSKYIVQYMDPDSESCPNLDRIQALYSCIINFEKNVRNLFKTLRIFVSQYSLFPRPSIGIGIDLCGSVAVFRIRIWKLPNADQI